MSRAVCETVGINNRQSQFYITTVIDGGFLRVIKTLEPRKKKIVSEVWSQFGTRDACDEVPENKNTDRERRELIQHIR